MVNVSPPAAAPAPENPILDHSPEETTEPIGEVQLSFPIEEPAPASCGNFPHHPEAGGAGRAAGARYPTRSKPDPDH
jgi:hypothetical protein